MRAVAQVFVDDLTQPELGGDDTHHLHRALRLRPGEIVIASDGAGGWRTCTYRGPGAIEPSGELVQDSRPSPALAVGFALVKGDRPEWIVQKLTECGIDRIVPFMAARSIVKWDESKAERQAARLGRVAVEAAMQSRRTWLPVVEPVQSFAAVATRAAADGVGLVLADPGGRPPAPDDALVLVGPEGGWDDAERSAAVDRVSLGPTVLRAETAALGVGIVLSALRSRVVAPAEGRGARS